MVLVSIPVLFVLLTIMPFSFSFFFLLTEAYFVGRVKLLSWINETFQLNYQKVEECASGAIYCQIFDALYPGKVAMSKVNFAARLEHEYVANFKILQTLLDKVGNIKVVPVDKLIKGKYQDNLEFLQWCYSFYCSNGGGSEDYDAVARRALAGVKGRPLGEKANNADKAGRPASSSSTIRKEKEPQSAASSSNGTSATDNKRNQNGSSNGIVGAERKQEVVPMEKKRVGNGGASESGNNLGRGGGGGGAGLDAEAEQKLKERLDTLNELQELATNLEKEKDFYLNKILEVENLCMQSEYKDTELCLKIKEILYSEAV